MFQNKAKTVAEYVAALPPERQAVVNQLRRFVKKHLPKGYQEQTGSGTIAYVVPLSKLPDTYNGQPLWYAGIAAQKNAYTLYLMSAYGDPKQKQWMAAEFGKRGKKFDMGKSCLHLKSLDDIPLDVVGEVIASVPMDRYIAFYRETRKRTAPARRAVAKAGKGRR